MPRSKIAFFASLPPVRRVQRDIILRRALCSKWEFTLLMKRFFSCSCAVLLLSFAATAQSPSTHPPAGLAAAPDQPGVTSTDSPEIAQFQKIEDNWADSV